MGIGGLWKRSALAAGVTIALAGCGSEAPETRKSATAKKSPAAIARTEAATRPAARPSAPAVASPSPLPLQLPLPSPAPSERAAGPEQPPQAAAPVPAKLASYPPKDECATLPGFVAFRAALSAAVRKRDAAALVALADPAVNLDFGGGSGPEELRRRLAANPALWGELAALDGLGCANDGGVATLPWIFSRLPNSVDAYTAVLVTGQGVPVRARAAAPAREVARLDWALVEAVEPVSPVAPRQSGQREIRWGTKDKAMRGFAESARLRDVLGYRLIADRQNGEWKITAFVAGD